MKKPENFNAGATIRKADPLAEAINSNFSTQAKKETVEKINEEIIAVDSLPKEFLSEEIQQKMEKEKKEKFLVSMAKGERANYKAFCAMKSISMNHFVMCAMDYFREDLEAGKVIITQHSYKRKG